MRSLVLYGSVGLAMLLSCDGPVNVGVKLPTADDRPHPQLSDELNGVLENCGVIDLPYSFELGAYEWQGGDLSLEETRFITGDAQLESAVTIGVLPESPGAIHVLWLYPADDMLPMLSTFSTDGELKQVEGLAMGECHPDACYACKETITIDRRLRLLATDSVRDCECDSTHSPLPGRCRRFVRSRAGLITDRGVLLSPIQQQELTGD